MNEWTDVNDLQTSFIEARSRDDEAIANQANLMDARRKDDENLSLHIQDAVVSKNAESQELPADQQDKVNTQPGELQPDMGFEIPSADMEFSGDQAGEVIDPEEMTMRSVRDATNDILLNAPKNVTMGAVNGLKHTIDAIAPNWLEMADSGLEEIFPEYTKTANDFFNKDLANASTSDRAVQEMANFMLPFGASMKMLGATTKMGMISKGFAADALASFFAVDPHLERLSNVATEMGIENDFIAYMADQTGTETENRLRNVVENQALGATFVTAAQALKLTWWGAKAVKAKYDKAGADKFLKAAGITTAATVATPDEAEAGLMDTIRARNAALNEAAGVEDVATQEEMPEDPRSDVEVLGSLPDDIYLEWNQTTPIKEWLWIKHPELLKGNGEA